jgi:hypothetical protein
VQAIPGGERMPVLNLRDVVETYRNLAGDFGRSVPLADFRLNREETESLFGAFDEDYHISRFFHFTLAPDAKRTPERVFQINGFPQSHVSLDSEIATIL